MNSLFYSLKRGKIIVYQKPGNIELSDLVEASIYLAKVQIIGTCDEIKSSEELLEALGFRDWLIECNLIRY